MSSNYVTTDELKELSRVVKAINKALPDTDARKISLGTIEVYDQNGEPVGFIAFTEGCDYAYYPNNPLAD